LLKQILEDGVAEEALREDEDVHFCLKTGRKHVEKLTQLLLLILGALCRENELANFLLDEGG